MSIEVAADTDVGRLRAVNQDAVQAATFRSRADGPVDRACLIVADGLGGHAAGEIASALAIETIADASAALLSRPDLSLDSADTASALVDAVQEAHTRVLDRATQEPRLTGMGTVIVVAWLVVHGGEAGMLLAHAGDSRAYHLAHGALSQVTPDHSWVGEAVREGRLTAAQARTDPRRNVVTRSLGAQETVEVELTGPMRLSPGDRILLCSDGLHGVVDNDALRDLLGQGDPSTTARALIDAANAGGGPDNIGVAIAAIG